MTALPIIARQTVSTARLAFRSKSSAQIVSSAAGPSRISRAVISSSTRNFTPVSPCGADSTVRYPGAISQAIPARRWNSSSSSNNDRNEGLTGTSTAQRPLESSPLDAEHDTNLRLGAPEPGTKSQKIAQIEPRLSLTFTCTADACGHRSTHEFSKRSYTKGIVLVQCPQCKNRHLIADHLGWFKESTEEGTLRTVEDLLLAKGETVRTGRVNFDGDIEYDGEPSVS